MTREGIFKVALRISGDASFKRAAVWPQGRGGALESEETVNGSWLGKNKAVSESRSFLLGDQLTYGKASSINWSCSNSMVWVEWKWEYERRGFSWETRRLPKRESIKKAAARNSDCHKFLIKENHSTYAWCFKIMTALILIIHRDTPSGDASYACQPAIAFIGVLF